MFVNQWQVNGYYKRGLAENTGNLSCGNVWSTTVVLISSHSGQQRARLLHATFTSQSMERNTLLQRFLIRYVHFSVS